MIPINQMVRAVDATYGTVIGRVYGHEADGGHMIIAVEPLTFTGHRFRFPEDVLTPVERAWVPVQQEQLPTAAEVTHDIPLQFRKPIYE